MFGAQLGARDGDEVVVRLHAPLSLNYNNVETGTVQVRTGQTDRNLLTVTETSATSQFLNGQIKTKPGEKVEAICGFGDLSRH